MSRGHRDRFRLLHGDCKRAMRLLRPNSVDAVVSDPPYGLEFMGLDFDSLTPKWRDFDDVPAEWIRDFKRERGDGD